MRAPEQVENERVECLKKINEIRETVNMLCIEKFQLKKRLVEVEEGVREGRHMIAVKKIEAECLQSEFWACKNG